MIGCTLVAPTKASPVGVISIEAESIIQVVKTHPQLRLAALLKTWRLCYYYCEVIPWRRCELSDSILLL